MLQLWGSWGPAFAARLPAAREALKQLAACPPGMGPPASGWRDGVQRRTDHRSPAPCLFISEGSLASFPPSGPVSASLRPNLPVGAVVP